MIDLRIESLAFGGDGVGRHLGQAVFVPLTSPGDLVRCKIVQRKRRYLRAEVVEILEPGSDRCQPRCPVYGRCGGCQWQHLTYPAQLQAKEKTLTDILRRQLRRDDVSVAPIMRADNPWNYRSRVQFKCRAGDNDLSIGFFRGGSHVVEAIAGCPIAAHEINQVLPWLYEHLPQLSRPERVSQVDVSIGDRGRPRLVIHDQASQQDHSRPLLDAAEKENLALFIQSGRTTHELRGPADVDLQVAMPPLWLGYGPGGFSQVNLAQNRALVKRVLDLADLQGDEKVLDLYCGMGNLTLPLARRCKQIDGVEDHAPAITQARRNSARNDISNARFFATKAEAFLASTDKAYSLVVLDPPRSGAFDVIGHLLRLKPTRIIYVSCDPMTLARDLGPLLVDDYRLVQTQAIDLFPQTYHLESISLLESVHI